MAKTYLDRTGLFYMANKIKGLLLGKANADLSNVDDSVFKNKLESVGGGTGDSGETGDSGGTPKVTTEGTGVAFTAEVAGITALEPGIAIIMTPHTTSTTTTPTLNVNGLGEAGIRRRLSINSTALQPGYSAGWLAAGNPYLLIYDGTYWIVIGQDRPASSDLSGVVAVENGGTGADTVEGAMANLGAMPKAGGTFDGAVAAGSGVQAEGEYLLRNTKLSLTEETPTEAGHICWMYK